MTYRDELRWHAFDTHGVVTTGDAAALGVPSVELRKLARRGALRHVGYGVYRMTEVPATPLTEYAEAVALLGPDAVVVDDAVLALHHLASVNPSRVRVAVRHRTRAKLPNTVEVVHRNLSKREVTDVDGIPVMTIAAALLACRGRVMPERLLQGVEDAFARNLIDAATAESLRADLQTPPSVGDKTERALVGAGDR